MSSALLDKIAKLKLIPVVKLNKSDDAKRLGEALLDGGLPVAEVTFRTDAACDSIKILKREYPEMLIGAGTVTTVDQVKRALDAGAAFLVSPGIDRSVVEYALDRQVLIFPGVCTPSEIMLAASCGLSIVKFFPAGQFGGLSSIKALSAPFPNMKFIPTGGVSASNLLDYLSFSKVIACGGSWMVKNDLIDSGNFLEITRLTLEAVKLIENKFGTQLSGT